MAITINGSGTVTGISAGGLPDGCVDAGTLATTLDLSGNTLTIPTDTTGLPSSDYVLLHTTDSTTSVSSIELRYFDLTKYTRYIIRTSFEVSDYGKQIKWRFLNPTGEENEGYYNGFIQSRRSDYGDGINNSRYNGNGTSYLVGVESSMGSSGYDGSSWSSVMNLDLSDSYNNNYQILGSGALMGDNNTNNRYGYSNVFGVYEKSFTRSGIKFFVDSGSFVEYHISIYGVTE